ncbi:hypothetical protein Asal01_02378 [Fodinibius salicampi]|nr:hypothetical protein [Fodinibius salicampi]
MVEVMDIISPMQMSDSSELCVFEKLMRRFELDKKMFFSYDDEIKNPVETKELTRDEYCRLAISFCLQAVKQEDIRFYNTALKIGDLADMELPEIKL